MDFGLWWWLGDYGVVDASVVGFGVVDGVGDGGLVDVTEEAGCAVRQDRADAAEDAEHLFGVVVFAYYVLALRRLVDVVAHLH